MNEVLSIAEIKKLSLRLFSEQILNPAMRGMLARILGVPVDQITDEMVDKWIEENPGP